MENNYYILNKETGKIELHFDKDTYLSLPDDAKSKIKSNYLFSRYAGAWVSRSKWPNTSWAEKVAIEIGLTNAGAVGERLSFEDQMNAKQERAERRAERYDNYADNAAARGKALQAPIESMHGDIAFFTQPNINSSAGRAFTNKRNKMFAAWERGFDEFKKSDYFKERAETARQTAADCKKQPIDFCQRRIDECNASIRKLGKNMQLYKKAIENKENGIEVPWPYKETSIETLNSYIDETLERIDANIDKAAYYQKMIDDQGGIKFNKDNINVGDIVRVDRRDLITVERKGPKNFIGKSVTGFALSYNYSEIKEVVQAQTGEREIKHGFKVGMKYTLTERLSYATNETETHICEIVKVTPDKVTIKIDGGRAKALVVRNGYHNDYYIPVTYGKWDHCTWLKPLEDVEKSACN